MIENTPLRITGSTGRSASFATDEAGEPIWPDAYLYACLAEEWT